MARRGPKAGFYYAVSALPMLGAGVVGPDVFHASEDVKELVFFGCLFAAFLLWIVGARKELREERRDVASGRRKRMVTTWGMIICGLGFLGFTAAHFWPLRNTETSASSTKAAAVEGPQTPLDLYKTDFPETIKLSSEFRIEGPGLSSPALVEASIYYAFNSNSKFLGFYVPASQEDAAVCLAISRMYRTLMDTLSKGTAATSYDPSDTSVFSSKTAVFSGIIYLYYERRFSISEKAAIDDSFNKAGARVQLRGPEYAATRWLQKEATPKPKS